MAEITISDLTTAEVDGTGVFDHLMKATKAHLVEEYNKNRLRGPEYSTVYLTGLQSAMDQAIRFLLDKNNAELLAKQIELADKQILKADKEILLVQAQIDKIASDEALTDAQTDVATQQKINLVCEEVKCQKQVLQIVAETLNVPIQGQVLTAQKCKLDADFDLVVEQKARVINESALIIQKKVTEQAQTIGSAADSTSAIGRQNEVLRLQAQGYKRLAEQQAAKIFSELAQVQIGTNENDNVSDFTSIANIQGALSTLKNNSTSS